MMLSDFKKVCDEEKAVVVQLGGLHVVSCVVLGCYVMIYDVMGCLVLECDVM